MGQDTSALTIGDAEEVAVGTGEPSESGPTGIVTEKGEAGLAIVLTEIEMVVEIRRGASIAMRS